MNSTDIPQPPSVDTFVKREFCLDEPPLYLKPEFGKNLVAIKLPGPAGLELQKLALRRLVLSRNEVVPFHLNTTKEKVYFVTHGIVHLITQDLRNGQLTRYQIGGLEPLITMPPNTWHALVCTCQYTILEIILSNNDDDVVWSAEADRFVPAV